MKLSGLTIIRNAFDNGYMIDEVIKNLKAICDEVIVCDGYSDDGTAEYLKTVDGITLYQDKWNTSSSEGLEFRKITDLGKSRCNGDYIFYLQSDELVKESELPSIKNLVNENRWNSINFKFHHIRYDFDYELDDIYGLGYQSAKRVIKNIDSISSETDGYNFTGNVGPCYSSEIYIFHFGYVFIRNILNKMINHAKYFYVANDNYQQRARDAKKFLERLDNGEILDKFEVHQVLEPHYKLKKHNDEIPEIAERLRNSDHYWIGEK